MKYLSSFINENSINNEMSSTLKSLALEIKNMHLNNWINKGNVFTYILSLFNKIIIFSLKIKMFDQFNKYLDHQYI